MSNEQVVITCSECGIGNFVEDGSGYLECTQCGAEASIFDFDVEDDEFLVMLPEVDGVLCVVKSAGE